MSTIGYESWAVDMADVGPVYPFQGAEFVMFLIGLAFWIGWHVIQFNRESAEFEQAKNDGDKDKIAANIDRY